jgi:hypothetical protein
MARGAAELLQGGVAGAPGVRIAAGVELDRRDTEVLGGVENGGIGVDEEADADPGLVQTADGLTQP